MDASREYEITSNFPVLRFFGHSAGLIAEMQQPAETTWLNFGEIGLLCAGPRPGIELLTKTVGDLRKTITTPPHQ
jgi:hypothetical protein